MFAFSVPGFASRVRRKLRLRVVTVVRSSAGPVESENLRDMEASVLSGRAGIDVARVRGIVIGDYIFGL